MSLENTRQLMERYLPMHDAAALAPDAVFTVMGTGQEAKGKGEVEGLVQYFYHVAFDAKAERKHLIVSDNQAVFEGDFVGRHTGDFAGIPATGKNVRVPLSVVYDIDGDKIARARIYFETDALRKQLGVG
jgi:steroid delta-isomerase-like uncharacterized protein